MKTEFPDNWNSLAKRLAYPYEYFKSLDDYKKFVDNIKEEDFLSELKNDYPNDKEIERTKEIAKMFNIKNGDELTHLFLKSDVLLLSCVFEWFIRRWVNEFDISLLCCVSLPGYTWQSGLKNTGMKLQTLQDKDLFSTLENNIRGGIASVMGDRHAKSDENKKVVYMVATNLCNLCGHSLIQTLLYDEILLWHGQPDLYMNKLEEVLYTPDDGDTGYFIEVDLRCPDYIKEKAKNFPFCLEKNFFLTVSLLIIWKR